MTKIDLAVIAIYLLVSTGIGILAGLNQSLGSFWVYDRRSGATLLIFSIIVTQVGAGALIGIASAAYVSGIGLATVSAGSTFIGFALVGYFAPRFRRFGTRFGAISLAEFLAVRYGRSTQLAASVVIVFVYLSFLAAQFLALSTILTLWTGIGVRSAVLLGSLGVLIYTAFAGLKGDFFTDAIHFAVKAFVLLLILPPFLVPKTVTVIKILPASFWSPATFGGWGFVVAGIALGGLLPLVSMEMWQHAYASSSERQVRWSFWIAIVAILPFYAIAMGLGLYAAAARPHLANPDLAALVALDVLLMPGLKGLAIAAMLATVFATANGMSLVLSATFHRDILCHDPFKMNIWTARMTTFAIAALGLGAALVVPSVVQLTLNAFYLLGVLFLPIMATFFWSRSTARAATASIYVGAATTIISLGVLPKAAYVPGLVLSAPVFIIGSLVTRHSPKEHPGLGAELVNPSKV